MSTGAICVQAFNKADTVIQTLESLAHAKLSRKFDLIIVQDGIVGSKFEDRYQEQHKDTRNAIESWLAANSGNFKSADFKPEERGRGTAGTARVAIDYSFRNHDWVIFSEDDLIYESDALEWFTAMITHAGFLQDDVWAIAGEAKHFDSKGFPVAESMKNAAMLEAAEYNLISKYCYFGWLPSSCFATNRKKWAEFGGTRGMARGPKMVNDRCKAENKKSLWPIIARCRDIGMHHDIGYSISIHKTTDKVPQKSNFIVSSLLEGTKDDYSELKNSSKIYQAYTKKLPQ